MALDEPLILDTQYAYNLAVGEARWREDYAQWEQERDYRADKFAIDVSQRQKQIQYDIDRETRRYEHDVDLAYARVGRAREQATEISVVSRKEKAEAEIAMQVESDKAREQQAITTVTAASFGTGRSLRTMLRLLGAEGAEKASSINLMAELQEAQRNQQLEGLTAEAQSALDTVVPYLEPVQAAAVQAPIEYRPPLYVKPLEPNLEGFGEGVTEDTYITSGSEFMQGILAGEAEGFIREVYREDLERTHPDPEGLAYWTNELLNKDKTGTQVREEIITSAATYSEEALAQIRAEDEARKEEADVLAQQEFIKTNLNYAAFKSGSEYSAYTFSI